VLTLGGYAVIYHGQSRPTYDADVWLDPMLPLGEWCDELRELAVANALRFVAIGSWQEVPPGELEAAVEEDGVIRLMGANQPLDIFRRPNELDPASFDEVWGRAAQMEDGTRLPDAVDLLVTKQLTGRAKDQMDILFLEQKAEDEGLALLERGSAGEIRALLERFLTPNLAAAACRHADPEVSTLARRYLGELAAEGDPFAADLLRELE
jgi:hypothetical protein